MGKSFWRSDGHWGCCGECVADAESRGGSRDASEQSRIADVPGKIKELGCQSIPNYAKKRKSED